MTSVQGETAAGEQDFARHWQALRADGDIQFAPLAQPKAPEPPGWLEALFRFLGRLLKPVGDALAALGELLGMTGPALAWILGALVAALIAWLLIRMILDSRLTLRRKTDDGEAAGWTPDHAHAQALLEDADALAAQGRFDEATHLLLRRSVQQIATARPGLLEPSSTAREIAVLPALPAPARSAFTIIADRVERSLFALRSLSAEDWHAARAAYADFALVGPGRT